MEITLQIPRHRKVEPEIHISLQHTSHGYWQCEFYSPKTGQFIRLCQCQIVALETMGSLEPSPVALVSFICGQNPICRRFVHLATGCNLERLTMVDKAGQNWRSRLKVESRSMGEGK